MAVIILKVLMFRCNPCVLYSPSQTRCTFLPLHNGCHLFRVLALALLPRVRYFRIANVVRTLAWRSTLCWKVAGAFEKGNARKSDDDYCCVAERHPKLSYLTKRVTWMCITGKQKFRPLLPRMRTPKQCQCKTVYQNPWHHSDIPALECRYKIKKLSL